MSKAKQISKKKKYQEYEKVMHLMYEYLHHKGLVKEFARYCDASQQKKIREEYKMTFLEKIKVALLDKFRKVWG